MAVSIDISRVREPFLADATSPLQSDWLTTNRDEEAYDRCAVGDNGSAATRSDNTTRQRPSTASTVPVTCLVQDALPSHQTRTVRALRPRSTSKAIVPNGVTERPTTANMRISYVPSSAASRLASAYSHSVRDAGHIDGWFDLVPARIGHNRTTDLMAGVFLKSCKYSCHLTSAAKMEFQVSYVLALNALGAALAALSMDDVLLAVAMLASTESTVKSDMTFGHMRGASALMIASQDNGKPASDWTRAVLYMNWSAIFIVPLFQGGPSPYETARWLAVDPAKCHAKDPTSARLRHLSHQLLCRLPRLIAAVRSLTGPPASRSITTFREAIKLAQDLLLLEDRTSENILLHRLSVRKPPLPADALVVPYSFHFPDYHLFEAAIYYWFVRIVLNQLCLRLCNLSPLDHPPTNLCNSRLCDENITFATNILMSLPHATSIGRLGAISMLLGPVALWSVTCSVPDQRLRTRPVSLIRLMVLRVCGELTGNPSYLSATSMDEAADMLAGGPIRGMLLGCLR